jgi:hypothetical protein
MPISSISNAWVISRSQKNKSSLLLSFKKEDSYLPYPPVGLRSSGVGGLRGKSHNPLSLVTVYAYL